MLDTGSGKPDYIRTQANFLTLNLVSGLHSPSKISFIIIAGRQAAKRKIASIMARKQYNKNNQEDQHKKENIISEPGRHNFTNLARGASHLPCGLAVPPVSPIHAQPGLAAQSVGGAICLGPRLDAEPHSLPLGYGESGTGQGNVELFVNVQQLPIPRPSQGGQWCAQSRRVRRD